MTALQALAGGTHAPATATAEGHAFLRDHASRRAVWLVRLSLEPAGEGLRCGRRFIGVDGALASEELADWSPAHGLTRVHARQPHLEEEATATIEATGRGWEIRYGLTRGGDRRQRTERVGHPVVSLASLPLFAAAHSSALTAGMVVKARFPVLKVMRSATVNVRALPRDGRVDVVVTPVNPVLRLLFGSTVCRFDAGLTALVGYDGVLDPRDAKPNGRWHEYLGTIEMARPLALPVL